MSIVNNTHKNVRQLPNAAEGIRQYEANAKPIKQKHSETGTRPSPGIIFQEDLKCSIKMQTAGQFPAC